MKRWPAKPRTREQKKTAIFTRLVMGRNKPSIEELIDAGYKREEAERLLANVDAGWLA